MYILNICCCLDRRHPRHCWIDSILSLWEFDRERIFKLSESDILSELNKDNISEYVSILLHNCLGHSYNG